MKSFWDTLPRPFFALAPMEAVTDVVFRHVVRRAGTPDIFFTEFANATGWVHAGDKAIRGRLVKTDDERPIVAQIWGGEPGDMESFARHCAELGYDGIDINMGCPAKSAVRSGGSALIRKPDVAIAAIATAKTAGLPVSVKTRLGYTSTDEWRDWLTTLLQQDIANLTIHLRTKKEMSKVPAHHELIPDIVRLRDELAPGTLLTINGDIANRAHGLQLVHQFPGVDGIMIGRGVFQDPFCFATELEGRRMKEKGREESHDEQSDRSVMLQEVTTSEVQQDSDLTEPALLPARNGDFAQYDRRGSGKKETEIRQRLELLHYHLDLFDEWQDTLNRPYETLKRFYKIYIRDFDGASDVRDRLMHTHSINEAREIIRDVDAGASRQL